jgi:hypothetical protein
VRLLQANIYKGNKRLHDAFAVILRLDPDVVSINEGIRAVPALREAGRLMARFRLVVNRVRSRGGWDTPILLNDTRNEVRGWWSRRQTRPSIPSKWAPARFTTSVAFDDEEGRTWRHFNVHLNAVIQSKRTWDPLLQAARTVWAGRQMASLERQIKRAQRRGRLVSGAGDLNWNDRRPSGAPWKWAPQEVFARCGLAWVNVGPDWVWFPASWVVTEQGVIDQDETGSDHKWLWVDVERDR